MKRCRSYPPVIQAFPGISVASQLSWEGPGSSQILYRHRPNGMVDPLIPDLDAWKLVVPEEQRFKVLK